MPKAEDCKRCDRLEDRVLELRQQINDYRVVLQELRKNYILNAWTRQDINERMIQIIRNVLFPDGSDA